MYVCKKKKPVTQEMLDRCDALVARINGDAALEIVRVIMSTKAPSEEWRLYGGKSQE